MEKKKNMTHSTSIRWKKTAGSHLWVAEVQSKDFFKVLLPDPESKLRTHLKGFLAK